MNRGLWAGLASMVTLAGCLAVTNFDVVDGTGDGGSAGDGGQPGTGGMVDAGGGGGVADCALPPCILADGGDCPEIIASTDAGVVVADATAFYTSDHANSQVRRFARKGCEVDGFSIATQTPDGVALLGEHLYWTNRESPPELERCAIEDCMATREVVLTDMVNPLGYNVLVAAGDELIVNRAFGEVLRLTPSMDDEVTVIATDPKHGEPELATNGLRLIGQELYWIRVFYASSTDECAGGAAGGGPFYGCTGAVVRAPLAGGTANDVVTGLNYPGSVGIDGTWAYYRPTNDALYLLSRSELDGATIEDLPHVAPYTTYGGSGPTVVVAGDWVYFLARDDTIVVQQGAPAGTDKAPVIARVRRDSFDAAGFEVVIDYEQTGLGLNENNIAALYIEDGGAHHHLYWSAGSTFWGAAVDK